MSRECEVCSSPKPKAGRKLRRMLVGDRLVCLCDDHAKRVADAAPETPEQLLELFPEPGGRRSLLDRRAPLDRRIFPPRPEGRRHGDGRRRRDEAKSA